MGFAHVCSPAGIHVRERLEDTPDSFKVLDRVRRDRLVLRDRECQVGFVDLYPDGENLLLRTRDAEGCKRVEDASEGVGAWEAG